ncbi:helix-turn-helix transcriptional regulator [Pseudoalteromonas marina]|uniref:Helix-turn-helix transcriptional regulator n=1 Tax=Pseudoalteromonas marina TaxID=267375 RepID=A0ABT9FI37_9GAMM|nr:helix-turn-helix transcriptional regulator [Pseudoalteromonas marina]MDP2566452.1 helix-turn-helix transcriptional regulator [Pseudoalteromonas marina]
MKEFNNLDRLEFIELIQKKFHEGELEFGDVVKLVRTQLYKKTQSDFAKLINISDRTLRDIEKNNTDPRLSIMKKVLKPCGFDLSITVSSRIIK